MKFKMRHLALLLFTFSLLMGSATSNATTPWETYVSYPSPKNARDVESIKYSENSDALHLGEQITADIKVLAIQVFSGDREAFRLALRLLGATMPGAVTEDLSAVAGRYVRQSPKAYLEDVLSSGLQEQCPGIRYVGLEYVDRDNAQAYEIGARVKALESVQDVKLARVRESCISILRK